MGNEVKPFQAQAVQYALKILQRLLSADEYLKNMSEDFRPGGRYERKPYMLRYMTTSVVSDVSTAIQIYLEAEKQHIDLSILPPLSDAEVKDFEFYLKGDLKAFPSLSDVEAKWWKIVTDGLAWMTSCVVKRPVKHTLFERFMYGPYETSYDYPKALLTWLGELYLVVMEMQQTKSMRTESMLVQARPAFARALDALRAGKHEHELAVYEQAFIHPSNG